MPNSVETTNTAASDQAADTTAQPSVQVIDDVCVIVSGDAGGTVMAPVIVEKPAAGDTFALAVEPGKKYFFNFEEKDVASFVQKDGDVTVTFKDGSTIVLENYADATTADAPAAFSFSDAVSADLIKVVDTTPEQENLLEEKSEKRADADDAQKVADIEPAAGDEAQKLAQIEPAAGDDAGGADRGGYGYQSSFDPQGVIPLNDVGPIGPTLLQYGVNFRNDILFVENRDDTPDISDNPAVGSGIENVDETGGLPQTVGGTVGIDFGDDGAGSFGATGGFSSSYALTSHGQPVTVTFDAATGTYTGTAGGNTIFTLTVSGNGAYSFTQFGPIDHADPTNHDDNVTLNFGIQIFDVDGDTDTGNIVINIFDDGPSIVADAAKTVDESLLGPISIGGNLVEDFGEDGPGNIHPNGDFTASGDFVGPNLTSGGNVITVTATATGYVGTINGGATTIFEVMINPLTGAYKFSLSGPLDHSPGGNQITLIFGAQIVDFDGDTASTSITINIIDDVPEIKDVNPEIGHGIENVDETNVLPETVNGNLPVDFGTDTPGTLTPDGAFSTTTPLLSHGQTVTVTQTANGYVGTINGGATTVFQITVQNNGDYSFTQFEPLDHPNAGNPNDVISLTFGVKVTDFDGDSDNGNIIINIFDDGPQLTGDGTKTIHESDLGPAVVNGDLTENFGEDGQGDIHTNGNFNATGDINGGVLTSNGLAITVTHTATGYVGTVNGGATKVFEVTINPVTGAYTFTLHQPLDHSAGGNQITLNFGAEIVDYDGDTDDATISIKIKDDVPNIGDNPGVGSGIGNVDETDVLPETVGGTVSIDFGGDGPGAFGANGAFNANNPLFSHGNAVTVVQTANGYVGTINGGATTVFQITINGNGDYSYTQFEPLDHPNANNPNDSIVLNFGIQISDSDGDTDTGNIRINVFDDGPQAHDDGNFVSNLNPINGNVLTNDSFGEDGPGAVVSVTFNGTTTNIADGATVNINGTYGTLQISSNGTYTYTPYGGIDGTDQFSYTMDDYDNDRSSANLTIKVDVDYCPVVINDKVVVDETDMNPTTSVSDTITANFGTDGPGTFAGNGGFTGGPFTSHGQPVNVAFNAGTNTYTGSSASGTVFTLVLQPNGNYTFTLIGTLDHPISGPTAADHNDAMEMQFGVRATDNDGDTANGTITVRVLDDGPHAVNDGSFANSLAPVNGNVLSNDDFGSDGPGAVVSVTFNGTTTNIPSGSPVNIVGTYGTLVINSNGNYTYTPKGGADGTDSFSYTMDDYDNDTSTAKLDIRVNVDSCPVVLNDSVVVDETNMNPTTSITDTITANFGNDGPGTFTGNGGFSGGPFTSHGQPVTVSYNAGTNTYTGSSASGTVFTLVLQSNGQYTFTLIKPLDHPVDGPTAADHNDGMNMQFGVTATDTDGDTANGTITVRVLDDGPVAVNDGHTIHNNTPITGNVLANDNHGEDGPGQVTSVTINGTTKAIAAGATVVILGQYGSLEIKSDGSYKYTPTANASGTDQFTYVMNDYDGDTASAKLTIDYTCPVTVDVNVGGDDLCIKEDGQGTVPVTASYSGGDGDEVLTLLLTGVKPGWVVTAPGWTNLGNGSYSITLAAGQKTYNGDITFKPPANSDVDLDGLNIKASVYDPDTGTTRVDNDAFDVNVGAVTDIPTLDVTDVGTQYWYYLNQSYQVPLQINSSVTDTDGSEQITKVVIKLNNPFTNGAAPYYTLDDMGVGLNKGTEVSPGVWVIPVNAGNTANALNGLKLVVPPGFNYGAIHQSTKGHHSVNITVETYAKEVVLSGDDCGCTCGNEVVVIKTLCLTFAITPLVIDLDRDGIEVVDISANVNFDMTNDGIADETSWVGADDGLLAIDLNGDGVINNQSELFGDNAEHADGFSNLSSYDSNKDGVIDAADDVFGKLLVWQDANQDGISQADELYSLADIGIASIDLNATISGQQVADSIITHQGTFTWTDGTAGTIADVGFNVRDAAVRDAGVTLQGTDGKDVIYGTAGNDILISGAGYRDVLFGGDGDDIFVVSADPDGGLDVIKDFEIGDVLDISGLLTGYDALTDAINDFVFKTEANGSTTISVDADGAAGPGVAVAVATLEGVTGLSIEQITHNGQSAIV